MLVYLDNVQSFSPDSALGRRRKIGLNENYARELLELHTLGVDGGYTQRDVTETARVLTGWTVLNPRGAADGRFRFLALGHDPGVKTVLGRKFEPAGVEEGERLLDMLAEHPSTARFLAGKLVRRFVADDPPDTLVDRVAATYRRTQGDIREMLREIFYSAEFFSDAAYRAKAKKPLEFVASSLRALDARVRPTRQLLSMLARLGEPLYLCQPPTGYPDTAEAWLNSDTLLMRWNLTLGLASGRVAGAEAPEDATPPTGTAAELVERLNESFLAGAMSEERQAKIVELAGAPSERRLRPRAARYIVGLMLASPEFQQR